jgi:hypothetical protein
MLVQLIQGQADPQILVELAKGRMRSQIAELERALTGHVQAHHRRLLSLH